MERKAYLVVNPHSASERTGQLWPRVKATIREKLGPFEFGLTRGLMHARELACSALEKGFDLIVAHGGDGTLNEVLNGFFSSGKPIHPQAALGYIPSGTGSDFSRTLGSFGQALPRQLETIEAGTVRMLDCGEACFCDEQGKRATRLFINEASMGFSGDTAGAVNRASKRWGGKVSFLIGVLRCLAALKKPYLRITVDGRALYEGPSLMAAVTNGRYFGGSMMIAPYALLDDGLFEVVSVAAMSRLTVLRKIGKIYKGQHLNEPEIRATRGKEVTVSPVEDPVLLEMDGELAGRQETHFRIRAAAVPFLC